MGISLAPDPTVPDPLADPAKPKPNLTLQGTSATAPLPTEYPSAPSTTGQPQNRLQLAETAFDTFAKSTAPQYTADLRQATQQAAGAGNLGSGNLRTTYGNLANQRALALDTEKSNLINQATSATIQDQQAQDATRIAGYNAQTGRMGTTGNLELGRGQLDLSRTGQAANINQTQQQIDLAKKTADINAQFEAGRLTLAQKNQALQELQTAQQYGLETQKLALATAAQDVATRVQLGQLSVAQAQQALNEKIQSGQLSVEQGRLAMEQINSTAQNKVAQQNANTNAGQLDLAKQQLAQQGAQFGLNLAQQRDLATLADRTANRQLDISSAQGQTTLMLELARIMGSKDLNSIDPNFLAAIAKSLGLAAGSYNTASTSYGGGSTSTSPTGVNPYTFTPYTFTP